VAEAGLVKPRGFAGVMVSSSFDDLVEHREALIAVINSHGLHPVVMEYDGALPTGTVIDSSLEKVRRSAAYIGVIGRRYGNVPGAPEDNAGQGLDACNPEGLSLTHLEFREARMLGRPILLFVMGDQHALRESDVELDPGKRAKLQRFREEAKRASADSTVQRVYAVFNSLGGFKDVAGSSVAALRRLLDAQHDTPAASSRASQRTDSDGDDPGAIPAPPALYARPPYLGSHEFVGRGSGLEMLNDWASPAEPHPVLLIEAIGGTGKSMLTWEWLVRHAPTVRDDWAGRFWYSFYEKGAVMTDFCADALAYMTGQPRSNFTRKSQHDLSEMLLHQLRSGPWLMVLDGLERILVAYHRHDASQLTDEHADTTTGTVPDGDTASGRDKRRVRDPREATRPVDDDLLKQLAAAGASKLLITSRLIPRVLLNTSIQPLPGVLLERLPGLRPADAEALLRAGGVRGDSQRMQDYLQRHCDCHPLVTGVIAGLVNGYLPARGDFDRWAADPNHGGHLDLGDLDRDLVAKRNHILNTAIDDLSEHSRRLLDLLGLLPQAVDYATLDALNPFRRRQRYEAARQQWEPDHAAYQVEHSDWQRHQPESQHALEDAVRDLERRGLLQYDHHEDRYDLHPVVRGVVLGRLAGPDRDQLGEQIVDHFTGQPHNPYDQAETLGDLDNGLTVVRTLLTLGRLDQAWDTLNSDLMDALLFNVEAYPEAYALLEPFFADGWTAPAADITRDKPLIASFASFALAQLGRIEEAVHLCEFAAQGHVAVENWREVGVNISNLARICYRLNRVAESEYYARMALDLSEALDIPGHVHVSRLLLFENLSLRGAWEEAKHVWDQLGPADPSWSRRTLRPGLAESSYAGFYLFPRGELTEADLATAEDAARAGKNTFGARRLLTLRGEWHLDNGEFPQAAVGLDEAVRLSRQAGAPDHRSEALLALARHHCHPDTTATRDSARRLAGTPKPPHLALARLWQALDDTTQALNHAHAAYRYAWADGEPYVRRHDLDQATRILHKLGADTPTLSPYDATQPRRPWEHQVTAAINELTKKQTD
jgi:tetratricopeptide (TPR) repeat protein